jgi:branched-chain amino acid transport system ATP-binding protein
MTKEAEILLEVTGLSSGYGAVPVIRDIDLQVCRGEIVALLGANGAGKTTTLLTIAGAIGQLGGSVVWRGKQTRAPLHRRIKQGMGIVFEERSVFRRMSARDNLKVAGVKPSDVLKLFPELEPRMELQAGLLSGGEQQMLVLGRALAQLPQLLLVDELSLGLAPLLVRRLLGAVRDAADAGVGVILVEQHVSEALSLADHACILSRGGVAMRGTGAEMQARMADIESAYLSS